MMGECNSFARSLGLKLLCFLCRLWLKLSYRDLVREVNILDCVQQLHAFAHRPLKGLPSGDQTHPAAAFIDHRCTDGVSQIARALRLPTRIDQTATAHVAVRHLVTHEIDRIISRELLVNELARLTVRTAQRRFNR